MEDTELTVRFSDDGEIILHYPDGTNDPTGIFPCQAERQILVRFAASTTGRTLLMQSRHREIHDNLTQLLRRDPARAMIQQACDRLGWMGCFASISVLVMDLDHFCRLNKQYGQTTGDKVLQWFAQILRRRTRASDIVARWGGDEFVVVTMATTTPAHRERHRQRDGSENVSRDELAKNGSEVARRILCAISRTVCVVGDIPITQGVTIGVATALVAPESNVHNVFDLLFERADAKLRMAKSSEQRWIIHESEPVTIAPIQSN